MNEQNLVQNSKKLTKEERIERASKAGKASAVAKRARKTLKEELLLLLSEGDTQTKISVAMIAEALNGNVKAFETIRDTIGEKPRDQVELSGTTEIRVTIDD